MVSAPPVVKLAYSVPEAVAVSGIGRSILYELIKAGKLAIVKIGSRTLIRHGDLAALLDDHVVAR
jgi:excisionase family DNA binding protein